MLDKSICAEKHVASIQTLLDKNTIFYV